MNRERSQVWTFTIMIVVLILMLFCPVVFGQVSPPLPPIKISGTIFFNDATTPLVVANNTTDFVGLYYENLTSKSKELLQQTGTNTHGQYSFTTPGISDFEHDYRLFVYSKNVNIGFSAPIHSITNVVENVTTSRAPTDLITIDSHS